MVLYNLTCLRINSLGVCTFLKENFCDKKFYVLKHFQEVPVKKQDF